MWLLFHPIAISMTTSTDASMVWKKNAVIDGNDVRGLLLWLLIHPIAISMTTSTDASMVWKKNAVMVAMCVGCYCGCCSIQ